MTALDGGMLLFLALVAAGGYRQGFVRGVARLATLGAIAAAAALLTLGLSPAASLESVLARVGLLFGGVVALVGTVAWLLGRAVPAAAHHAALNRWLGIVPALAAALLVLSLTLGMAQRIAFGDRLERYLAGGVITGPLARPVQIVELALIGAPR